jgi:hypothetical protein
MSRFTLIGLVLLAAGCASDESVICERLAECNELPEGLTVAGCEEQAVRQVSETRREACADCVEEEECDTLVDGCRSVCEPNE